MELRDMRIFAWLVILICIIYSGFGFAVSNLKISQPFFVQGIYISQATVKNTKKFKHLISNSKKVGINTFVVDTVYKNKRFEQNVALLQKNHIRHVARIVVFPGGGNASEVKDVNIWEKKLLLAQYAIKHGAEAIQLDYIRYSVKTKPSVKNEHDVHKVIKYFRANIPQNIKLEIDIFGVAAEKPSRAIGQNAELFASTVDAINPMHYPSHYDPVEYHADRPYQTVLKAIDGLKSQLKNNPKVHVYGYIELFNYRHSMDEDERINYIKAQLQAIHDEGGDGFYAWSAGNKYDLLFKILEEDR